MTKRFMEIKIIPEYKGNQCSILIEKIKNANISSLQKIQADQFKTPQKVLIKQAKSVQKKIIKENQEQRVLLSDIKQFIHSTQGIFIQIIVIGKPDSEFIKEKFVSFIKIKDESGVNQLVFLKIKLTEQFINFQELFKIQCEYRIFNFQISIPKAKSDFEYEIKILNDSIIQVLVDEQPIDRINQLIHQQINHEEELNFLGLILFQNEFRDQIRVLTMAFPEGVSYNTIELFLWAEFQDQKFENGQIIFFENVALKNYKGILQLKTLKKSKFIKEQKHLSMQYRQQWALIEKNKQLWQENFEKKQQQNFPIKYGTIHNLDQIFPPYDNEQYNFIVRIKQIVLKSDQKKIFEVYYNENFQTKQLILQGKFQNEQLLQVGNSILLANATLQIQDGEIEICGQENKCQIHDIFKHSNQTEQIKTIISNFKKSYESEQFANLIIHDINKYQPPFQDKNLNVIIKFKEIIFSKQQLRKVVSAYYSNMNEPITIAFFGNLSTNPLIEKDKIVLIKFVNLKMYQKQKEIVTFENRTQILELIDNVKNYPVEIKEKIEELKAINQDKQKIQEQQDIMIQSISKIEDLIEDNKIYTVLVMVKQQNKPFECSNKNNKHYQKKIIIVQDMDQKEIVITLWRSFAETDFMKDEIVLITNLVYKKKYFELTSCQQTQIVRQEQFSSELQELIPNFKMDNQNYQHSRHLDERIPIIEINLNLSNETEETTKMFQTRAQFVDFQVTSIQKSCPICKGVIDICTKLCSKDAQHKINDPKISAFVQARISDFSGYLEVILSDKVIDQMITSNITLNEQDQLLQLLEKHKFKNFILTLKLFKKKVRVYNVMPVNYKFENQILYNEIINSLQ